MKLSELHKYDDIVIQCHNNPDPDTIGAGYALYKYFKSLGKEVKLIYSGRLEITKPNVRILINALEIPLEYVETIAINELLIIVDCQYGASNVRKFSAPHIAVIDHHEQETTLQENCEVRSFLASTATVVWDMLIEEGIDVNKWPDVATALYYGLFMDSSGFSEINHPLDKDMRDSLEVDNNLIRKLKNSVLTLSELEIAGMALIRHSYNAANKFVIIKAQECDPNILGFISDLAIQVDSVEVCIVYNHIEEGIKFSVRSCTKEVMANELAAYLSEGLGSGGGHIDKAGGIIKEKAFNKKHEYQNADEFFLRKLAKYYKSFEVIDALESSIDTKKMKLCTQTSCYLGVVSLNEIVALNTAVTIRTIAKDLELVVNEEMYIIIGEQGGIYPITKEKFDSNYKILDESYNLDVEYFPSIRTKNENKVIHLEHYAKQCIAKEQTYFYAKPIEKNIKLFTKWDREKYVHGKPGDYLVVVPYDNQEINIIKKEIFISHYGNL